MKKGNFLGEFFGKSVSSENLLKPSEMMSKSKGHVFHKQSIKMIPSRIYTTPPLLYLRVSQTNDSVKFTPFLIFFLHSTRELEHHNNNLTDGGTTLLWQCCKNILHMRIPISWHC